MSSVSAILAQLAENAGRARLTQGAIYGNLVAQASQIPGQIMEDRERQAGIDLQRQREAQQITLAQRADVRATADQAYQDTTRAQELAKQVKVRAIIQAYTDGTPNDPSTNNLAAGIAKAKEVGLPEFIPNLWELHQKEQEFYNPKPYQTDPTHDTRDPRTNQIITPGAPRMPEMGTPAYDEAIRIRDLMGGGVTPGAPPIAPPTAPPPPSMGPSGPGAPATTAAPTPTATYAGRVDQLQNGPPPAAPPPPTPDVWDASGTYVGPTTIGPPPKPPAPAPPPRRPLTLPEATAQAAAERRAAEAPPNEFQAFKTSYPATVRDGATWETLSPQEQQAGLTTFAQRARDPNAAAQLAVLRNLTADVTRQRLADAQRTSGPAPVVITRPPKEQYNSVEPTTGQTYGAIFQAGMTHALEGKYPPVGMGQSKQSQNVRSAVSAASAAMANEAGVDLPELRAEYRANSTALNKLIPAAAFTASSAGAAQDNLDLALAQSANVPRGGAKLVNRYTNWVKGELTPAAGLTQLETYIYTAAREYAKVVSGSAQSVAGLSDTAAKEAERLLNAAQAPEAFAAAATAMKNDMANVTANQTKAIGQVSGTIANFLAAVNRTGGVDTGVTPPPPPPPPGAGAPIVVVDPQGGRHPFATQAQADAFKRLAGIK